MDRKPRASWDPAKLPLPLSPEARRSLIAANAGFDAESKWAELEFWVGLAVMADSLSAPAKECRAELADVVRVTEQLDALLAGLHAPTWSVLWPPLHRAGKTGSWFAQVTQDLSVMASLTRAARDSISGRGGRAPLELRDGVIFSTCAWVDSLRPLRARAGVQIAISRNAENDRVHIPLVTPKDDLEQRRLKSVKTILTEVGLPIPRDLLAIIRRVLAKKPTAK